MTILAGALVAVGLASGASALSVDPNPLDLSGGRTSASVDFKLDGLTLQMKLSVDKGKLSRTRVKVVSADNEVRQAVDYGVVANDPDGVNIRRVRVLSDGSVEFFFKSSLFHHHIHAGHGSDPFYVTYASLAAGDTVTLTGYRYVIFGSFGSAQATIVPEPSAALLVGLGIAGLAVVGRGRA